MVFDGLRDDEAVVFVERNEVAVERGVVGCGEAQAVFGIEAVLFGIKGSATVYAFTVYAAGRGLVCDEFSTHSDASQRMPTTIPPTMAMARESAVLA